MTLHISQRSKNFVEIADSHTVSEMFTDIFYTKIQAGHKIWWESNFRQKVPDECVQPTGKKLLLTLHHFRDKCVFVFYAEFQNGCKKLQENNFCQNFVKIALPCTVSKINLF